MYRVCQGGLASKTMYVLAITINHKNVVGNHSLHVSSENVHDGMSNQLAAKENHPLSSLAS